MKLKFKIAATFSLICTGIIALVAIFIYFLVAANMQQQFNKRLLDRAYIAAEISLEEDELSETKYQRLTLQHFKSLPGENETFFKLNNNRIDNEAFDYPGFNEEVFQKTLENTHTFFKTDGKPATAIYYKDNQGDFIIILSAEDIEGTQQLGFLIRTLSIIVLISLILILVVSLIFAEIILKPIRSIINKAETISASNLNLRLKEPGGKDEISRLAKTFNKMLSRIQTAFNSQKQFIHNASHELRTPLTVILGESEYVLQREKSESHNSIKKIHQQAEHLNELLTSLLQLSDVHETRPEENFLVFRVDELVQRIAITANDLQKQNRVRLEYQNSADLREDSFEILGNILWIEIALTNIINNALKYSFEETVVIRLKSTIKTTIIEVTDAGIGIVSTEMEEVFTTFFRGENAKSQKGYGIGLALAHNIIQLHKGEINISSQEHKGTSVKIILPNASRF
ncbi:HAMP domain-containing histidine kinase [Gramella sp. GC03-9]|uniref:histidine kinase n=1 Tax=Christiangramia oceanisediminis TaxID=2920386 RepID=A0A9X2KXF2_9FLAO|nr:HAMP domain-containing sensor histidine kinase [Gramella oceanisediminis]MCP9199561.1 HAMP domain-containing histidine kinase [Gramella oceanisediminis]